MKVLKIIFKLFMSLALILSIIFITHLLINIGFIYNKYVLIILIFSFVLCILLVIKINTLKNIILKIIIYIFSILLLCIQIYILLYLYRIYTFVDNIGNEKDSYNCYYVVMRVGSKYNNITNKILGSTNKVSSEVLEKINITKKIYSDVSSLYEDLKENIIDFMIISEEQIYILNKQLKNEFINNTRILKKIKVKEEKNNTLKKSFILYISGIDTYGSISNISRSDVNIIVTVNTDTHQILFSAVPRDYYVRLHGTSGYKDKLAHSGIYGINMSVQTLEDLINIKIDYYIKVNFDTLIKLIDKIGNIKVYSDKDLDFCNIKVGYNTLDSSCALRFARERKSYITGDRHRGENQEIVLNAIINKVQNNNILLTKYDEILNSLEDSFDTNISNVLIKEIIKNQMKYKPKWSIYSYNLDGFDSYEYTYSYNSDIKLYVMKPNTETINNLKIYIENVLNGKKIVN